MNFNQAIFQIDRCYHFQGLLNLKTLVVKIKLALFILTIFGTNVPLYGQGDSETKNNFQLMLGAIHYRLIDEAFTENKLLFSGTSFAIDLAYQRKSNGHVFKTNIGANKGNVVAQEVLKADVLYLQMATSFATRVKKFSMFGKSTELYFGSQLSIKDYVLSDNEIIENTTVLLNNSVGLYLYYFLVISTKSTIEADIALPLIGLHRREQYDGGTNKKLEKDFEEGLFHVLFTDYQFGMISPLNLPQMNINYILSIGETSAFTVNYVFNYAANDSIQPIKLYTNGLLVGLRFNF